MNKKYPVRLTAAERAALTAMVSAGEHTARQIRRAQILLKSDESEGGPRWSYAQVQAAFDVSPVTIGSVRKAYVAQGLEAALVRKPPERVYKRVLDGRAEVHLVALTCSAPPKGQARWSLRLLADKLVELEVVESVSHETIRQALKKTS